MEASQPATSPSETSDIVTHIVVAPAVKVNAFFKAFKSLLEICIINGGLTLNPHQNGDLTQVTITAHTHKARITRDLLLAWINLEKMRKEMDLSHLLRKEPYTKTPRQEDMACNQAENEVTPTTESTVDISCKFQEAMRSKCNNDNAEICRQDHTGFAVHMEDQMQQDLRVNNDELNNSDAAVSDDEFCGLYKLFEQKSPGCILMQNGEQEQSDTDSTISDDEYCGLYELYEQKSSGCTLKNNGVHDQNDPDSMTSNNGEFIQKSTSTTVSNDGVCELYEQCAQKYPSGYTHLYSHKVLCEQYKTVPVSVCHSLPVSSDVARQA